MSYSAVRFPYKFNLRDFEVEGHFPLEARRNLLYRAVGAFSRSSPIVRAVSFRLVFDAMLIPLATWSSNSADRI